MRHPDLRLTTQLYTDEAMLDIAGANERLENPPAWDEMDGSGPDRALEAALEQLVARLAESDVEPGDAKWRLQVAAHGMLNGPTGRARATCLNDGDGRAEREAKAVSPSW
jgi:hypothetical protein